MSDETAQAVRTHVDQCPACLQLLAALSASADGAASSPPNATEKDNPAPELVEEYRLLRPLGAGAMGKVYLAQDTRLDRLVAIKLIAAPEPNEAAYGRFLVEARAIARLTHPNVVGIYRAGEVEGRPYLVSQYVRGQSLAELPKPLASDLLLKIALGLSCGLAAAHRCGVLHRDLKPANAILSDDGEVKLLDFGLAKLMDPAPVALPAPPVAGSDDSEPSARPVSMTARGALIGTPAYLAPELWQGAAATFQTDIYSLGALIYELASGHPPHRAASVAELRRCVLSQEARSLAETAPGVDVRLAAIVDRCLHRDPARRFASADQLRAALELCTDEGQSPRRFPLAPKHRPHGWLLAALLAVPLLTLIGGYSVSQRRKSQGRAAKLVEVEPKVREQVTNPLPIPADQLRLLEAMDRYAHEGPESAELLSINFRRANILYGYHHYREALPLFRDIAEHHPTHETAIHSANLLLDCLHLLKEQEVLAQQVDRLLGIPELLKDPELRTTLEKLKLRLSASKKK